MFRSSLKVDGIIRNKKQVLNTKRQEMRKMRHKTKFCHRLQSKSGTQGNNTHLRMEFILEFFFCHWNIICTTILLIETKILVRKVEKFVVCIYFHRFIGARPFGREIEQTNMALAIINTNVICNNIAVVWQIIVDLLAKTVRKLPILNILWQSPRLSKETIKFGHHQF